MVIRNPPVLVFGDGEITPIFLIVSFFFFEVFYCGHYFGCSSCVSRNVHWICLLAIFVFNGDFPFRVQSMTFCLRYKFGVLSEFGQCPKDGSVARFHFGNTSKSWSSIIHKLSGNENGGKVGNALLCFESVHMRRTLFLD